MIHTGWWGCGAFGGNRRLMAILQFAAAQLAGVDAVVFHRGSDDAADEAGAALEAWASQHRLHGETRRA